MHYYDDEKNVQQYIEMCEGYDGSNLYQLLAQYLSDNASLLELGSGSGHDLAYLAKRYKATGSDLSEAFLSHCRQAHPQLSFIHVDAINIRIKLSFDCIFSNKVLHHLTREQLANSLRQQRDIINPAGVIAHSFWLGEKDLTMHGMLFSYYQKQELLDMISVDYELKDHLVYSEFEDDDSIFVVARKKN